jgi:ABC-type multidrug transport system ATPase subunit/pSer/pThr/pTyr-binding forkhead associated (FHA) protein
VSELSILTVNYAGETREYRLTQTPLTIGRNADNLVVLNSDIVSRYHARLEQSNGTYQIVDLGSSNGTNVNGNELEPRVPYPIREGDVITIAGFTLTLKPLSAAQKEQVSLAELKTEFGVGPGAFTAQAVPSLIVVTSEGSNEYPITRDRVTVGRNPGNDIVISDSVVSRSHAIIEHTATGYKIVDAGSANGLIFESAQVSEKVLNDGDVLWITDAVSLTFKMTAAAPAAPVEEVAAPVTLDVKGRASLSIGRSHDNDIVLGHPAVSRKHARVTRKEPEGIYVIEDVGSMAGTFVNGSRVVQPRPLKRGDTIHVGPIKLIYTAEAFEKIDESSNLRVDAVHLNQFVSRKINLLQDISLTIKPNEFVAIVGGSGSGKSTLLKALTGFMPASNGSVLINGDDLYSNFDAHRSQFGFVPQEDIIHKELTVYEALDYSARLRLPADTSADDRKKRINEVLATLDLTERKDLQIKKLSGGQLKRVSIGVELLTKPGFFCLDEATSGLDPGMESQIMRMLRKLSDQGCTILLVTHATQNVMLCDHVIFLTRGGYLAYFGPPDQALTYFETSDFNSIYEKLEKDKSPTEWAEMYRNSEQYRQYVAARAPGKGMDVVEGQRNAAKPGAAVKQISAVSQFLILSRRNINVLTRDRLAMILMLLLAPIMSMFFFLSLKHGMLDPVGGDAPEFIEGMFYVTLISYFACAIAMMREVVKEVDIYRRERMVTLKIFPYVMSKFWVAGLLALFQTIIFVIFIRVASGWPGSAEALPVFITLLLSVIAAMTMGLLVSSISPNQNITPLLIIFVIAIQFVFGSGEDYGGFARYISPISSVKWSSESLVAISGIGKEFTEDPCWQLSEEERDALTEEQKDEKCPTMGVSLFANSNFPGIQDFYHSDVDMPEPLEPEHPGDPPPQPEAPPSKPSDPPTHPGSPPPKPDSALLLINPILYWQEMENWQYQMSVWQVRMEDYAEKMKAWESEMGEYGEEMKEWEAEMNQYKADLEYYQDLMDQYQDDMEQWQEDYQDWKENRSKAVEGAEGLIERIYEAKGDTFKASVARNWLALCIIIVITCGLIFGALKLRDRKR